MDSQVQLRLHNARENDILLLRNPDLTLPRPYPSPPNNPYRLLVITNVYRPHPGSPPQSVLARDVHSIHLEDRTSFEEWGSWVWQACGHNLPRYFLQNFLNHGTDVLLRPSQALLHETIFSQDCHYEHCVNGLVRVSPATTRDMRILIQREGWTLCLFCMGETIFERHERFARGWGTGLILGSYFLGHLGQVNDVRAMFGYGQIPETADLRVLVDPVTIIAPGVTQDAPGSGTAPGPGAAHSFELVGEGRLVSWYWEGGGETKLGASVRFARRSIPLTSELGS